MAEVTDEEIDAIYDEAKEAAIHAWLPGSTVNPYHDDPQRRDIWDFAFRQAFMRENRK